MPSISVPDLQQKLYKRMGVEAPSPSRGKAHPRSKVSGSNLSRKDQRKAHRIEKKSQKSSGQRNVFQDKARAVQREDSGSVDYSRSGVVKNRTSGEYRAHQGGSKSKSGKATNSSPAFAGFDSAISDLEDGLDNSDIDETSSDHTRHTSSTIKEKLAQDDEEIEELERKLGIKKGRRSMPQAFKDDGLADLLEDMVDDAEDSESEAHKRKRDYDEWLSSKRRKTGTQALQRQQKAEVDHQNLNASGSEDENVRYDELQSLDGDESYDEESGSDKDAAGFDELESDQVEGVIAQLPRKRENPYVAPSGGSVVSKYVPPSLRKTFGSDEEAKSRLRKQTQGLINRLTEANVLSIVQSAETLYQTNARGEVTEVVTDAIMAQISKPETLPDQFFVLTGGFAAAIYKTVGSSFGSHLIRRIVKDFSEEYEAASMSATQEPGPSAMRKETSNLIALLAQLYAFDVVTCKIMFDYMERLLIDLTEINVELLLRICRMVGRLLRRDDALALKHVSIVLNKAVSKVGFAKIPARTKFMVEIINDLKNSKPKARGTDSVVVSEHVQRMKKRLGELKTQSRRLDGLAPMGVSLEDIESADTKGKWWLVGASVPAKGDGDDDSGPFKRSEMASKTQEESTDEEDMDMILPDYPQKARAQGLSTPTQITVFTALMSASSYEHGYRQFLNLRLKKDDQLEVARVLVQCVGSELQYNPYYALVAKQVCSNAKIRFAFQDKLWRIFRGLGESIFGEDVEDDETADGERMKDERRIHNVARFYASLVADDAMAINVLKPLELPKLNEWGSLFVQWFLITLLQACRSADTSDESMLDRVFRPAQALPALAAGLHWFLRKKVRKSKVVSSKELKGLERVRETAQRVVHGVADTA